jgi:hypothetical protein
LLIAFSPVKISCSTTWADVKKTSWSAGVLACEFVFGLDSPMSAMSRDVGDLPIVPQALLPVMVFCFP